MKHKDTSPERQNYITNKKGRRKSFTKTQNIHRLQYTTKNRLASPRKQKTNFSENTAIIKQTWLKKMKHKDSSPERQNYITNKKGRRKSFTKTQNIHRLQYTTKNRLASARKQKTNVPENTQSIKQAWQKEMKHKATRPRRGQKYNRNIKITRGTLEIAFPWNRKMRKKIQGLEKSAIRSKTSLRRKMWEWHTRTKMTAVHQQKILPWLRLCVQKKWKRTTTQLEVYNQQGRGPKVKFPISQVLFDEDGQFGESEGVLRHRSRQRGRLKIWKTRRTQRQSMVQRRKLFESKSLRKLMSKIGQKSKISPM